MFQPYAPAIVEHNYKNLRSYEHHVAFAESSSTLWNNTGNNSCDARILATSSSNFDQLQIQRQPFALHIGLVWASGADNKDMYSDKSMALKPLMRLFDFWREERFVVVHSLTGWP